MSTQLLGVRVRPIHLFAASSIVAAALFASAIVGPLIASAAVTAITVGSQTGSLTAGTAGSATYTVSFTKTGNNNTITGLAVSGLPAGASAQWSATSSTGNGSNNPPSVTLTITTTAAAAAGSKNFTVTSSSPPLTATGTLLINAAVPPPTPTVACTVATPTNKVANGCFEEGTGNTAPGWSMDNSLVGGTGSLTIDTTDVHSGTRAAKAQVTSFTSGDLKWLPAATSTAAGKDYILSEWYKSSTTTQLGYFANDGFHWLRDVPPAATWTQIQVEIFVPAGVTSLQVAHLIYSVGTLSIDDVSLQEQPSPTLVTGGHVTLSFDDGWNTFYNYAFPILASSSLKSTAYIITQANLPANDPADYMSDAQIKSIYNSGLIEIGDHTRNHVDLVKDDPIAFGYANRPAMWQGEIVNSRTDLQTLLPGAVIDTFAYPYGSYSAEVQASTSAAGFIGARSVDEGYNTAASDRFALKQQHITNTTTFAQAQAWIDYALANKVWLIMMFHDVWPTIAQCVDREHPDLVDQDCTDTSVLSQIVNYLRARETAVPGTVVTVHDGLNLLTNTDTVAPVIAAHANVTASTTAASTTVIYTLPTVTDNVSTGLTASCTPPSGSLFALGTTTVTCTAADTANNHATSTFSVIVTTAAAVNAAPVAQNQSATTTKNVSLSITLTATDTDSTTLTFATTSNPTHGNLSGSGTSLIYTPATDYVGNDSFSFAANDGTSTSNVATISIVVSPTPNQAPVANAQSVLLTKNGTASITLTGTDGNNDTLTFATTSNPAHGTLTGSGAVFTYTPSTDYVGNDSFNFMVNDGTATSSTATVTITVNDVVVVVPPGNGSGGGNGGGGGGTVVGLIGTINTNPTTGGLVLGASTQVLTDAQIKAILDLLKSFNADQSVIDSVNKALHGESTGSTSTGFVFTKTLQVGSTGTEVTELQKRLTAEGVYSGPITGYFGPLTKAAVVAYQKKYGLEQVGIVGPKTRAMLNK